MGTWLTVAHALRSRMWKLVAALGTVAIVASVGITACAEQPVAPLASSAAAIPAGGRAGGQLSLENVGEFHNSFLDFAFPRLRTAVARGKGRAELCVVIAQAMRDFVAARKLGIKPSSIRDDIAGGECVANNFTEKLNGPRFALAVDDVPIGDLDVLVSEIAMLTAENLPVSTLTAVINDKVAYARAYFPAEEADIVAATGEIALSSASYWDGNYASQEKILLQEAGLVEALSRVPNEPVGISASRSSARMNGMFTPPDRRSDGWLTDIENNSRYPRARKVAVADISGAVRGGISGWRGGWQGIVAGAAIEGGAASAGGFLREVFKPWSK